MGVFDLEVMHSPEDGGGWEAARRGECGVSCVALYDKRIGRVLLYNEHDLIECVEHMNDLDLLVSYNGIAFDTPCLQGVTGMDIHTDQYDILHEIWKALPVRSKGWKLSDVCSRLGLGGKAMGEDGSSAVRLYQEGNLPELYRYCRGDVALTGKLANFINENGFVLTPDDEELPLNRLGFEV